MKNRKSKITSLYPGERKFLSALSEGKSPTEAAMTAYHPKDRKVASQMGHAVMKRPRFLQVSEKAGISDRFLALKLKEGFESLKPVTTKEGVEQYPDYLTRLGYLKTALKLKGHLNDELPETEHEPLIISAVRIVGQEIQITNKSSEKLGEPDTHLSDSKLPVLGETVPGT